VYLVSGEKKVILNNKALNKEIKIPTITINKIS